MHLTRQRIYGTDEYLGTIRPRGTGTITDEGYIRVTKNGRNRGEHAWVYEEYLGRELHSHEEIHHRNGDRSDNRLSNLELWSTSQPAGQRIEDKLKWAEELIQLYGPLSEYLSELPASERADQARNGTVES